MFDPSEYRGRIVLLDKDALEALKHVSSMQGLRAWENVYIMGRPPLPVGGALYTTYITNAEVLEWQMAGALCLKSELADEAYSRWLEVDREHALEYDESWTGRVEAMLGGYQVWIEADDSDAVPPLRASLEQAQELTEQLRDIGTRSDRAIRPREIRELDEERAGVEADLAEILTALLPTLLQLVRDM